MLLVVLLAGCKADGKLTVCTRQPAERFYWRTEAGGRPLGSTRLRLGDGFHPLYCGTAVLPKGPHQISLHDGECFSSWHDVRVRGQKSRLDLETWICGDLVDTGFDTGFLPIPF